MAKRTMEGRERAAASIADRASVASITVEIGTRELPDFTTAEAMEYVCAALTGGETFHFRRAFSSLDEVDMRGVFQKLGRCREVPVGVREQLHSRWVAQGHDIRKWVGDDCLIIAGFRAMFPPYKGEDMLLYRGERSSEFNNGRIGLNWTPDEAVARTFMQLCRGEGDSYLLRAFAPAASIITGPNDPSMHLGEIEYIVEPSLLQDLQLVYVIRQDAVG